MLILGLFMMHFNLLLSTLFVALLLPMAFCAAHSPTRKAHVGTVVHLPFSVFSQWRNLLSKHRTCLAISREDGHVIFAMQGIMMHLVCHMYVGSWDVTPQCSG